MLPGTTDRPQLPATTTEVGVPGGVGRGNAPPADRSARDVWQPCATTLVVVVLLAVTGIRGADYPAHLFRAALWSESGPSLWNFHWYGGHPTPTYGILSPPVVALLGAFTTASVAAVVSTHCFARLTTAHTPGRTTALANHVFAVLVGTNVVIGRVAFSIGLACALVAVLAWSSRLLVTAVGAAGIASMASPVAGVLLALVAAAVLVDPTRRDHSRRVDRPIALAVVAASLAPIVVANVLFEVPGTFPFRGGHFVVSMSVLGAAARWSRCTIVRVAAVLVGVVSSTVFVVPNALGGNIVRLAQIVGVPLLVVALGDHARRHRLGLGLTAVLGVGWSLSPAVVATAASLGDPSSDAAYHTPLIEEVRRRNGDGLPVGRLEIPFTRGHWESYHVAAEVPYARGWERQADIERNPELYDPMLDEAQYRRWLRDHAVRWIAVPDVAVDHSGLRERDIVRAGGSWRRLVWRDAHWELFEVLAYTPIVDPPATLVEQAGDRVVLRVDRAATVTVRFVYDPHLSISSGACARATADGWIEAILPQAGDYELRPVLRHAGPCGTSASVHAHRARTSGPVALRSPVQAARSTSREGERGLDRRRPPVLLTAD